MCQKIIDCIFSLYVLKYKNVKAVEFHTFLITLVLIGSTINYFWCIHIAKQAFNLFKKEIIEKKDYTPYFNTSF